MPNARESKRRWVRFVGTAMMVGSFAGSMLLSDSTQAARPTMDRESVRSIVDGSTTGRSTLQRNERGIRAVVRTTDLERGHAYTVWAVVFNHPDACDGPCDVTDLANPEVDGVSTLFSGKVARGQTTSFVGDLDVGEMLTDPYGSEVHFVVRTHGAVLPDLLAEQLTTLNGGCPPNDCVNVQMAVHR
jgi:hypothetical protein